MKIRLYFPIAILVTCLTLSCNETTTDSPKTSTMRTIYLRITGYGNQPSSLPENDEDIELLKIASSGKQTMQKYCYECHSNSEDTLNLATTPFKSRLSDETLKEEILNRIQLSSHSPAVMPPKEITTRPSNRDIQAIIQWSNYHFVNPDDTTNQNDQSENALVKLVFTLKDEDQATVYSDLLFDQYNIPEDSRDLIVSINDNGSWKEVIQRTVSSLTSDLIIDVSPNRINPDYLNNLIINYEITSVESFIDQLPKEYLSSFAMMRQSKSRHVSSLEYPRIISYGNDSSTMIAISTHPEDPAINEVEVVFFDESDYQWKFFLANFSSSNPQFFDATTTCGRCHGNPARPIWGSYPDWPGALGDSANGEGAIIEEEFEVLNRIQNDHSHNPRLAKFSFKTYQDQLGDTFRLEIGNRIRLGGELVSLTQDISALHSLSLFQRIDRQSPNYETYGMALLFDQICSSESFSNPWLGFESEVERRWKDYILEQHKLISEARIFDDWTYLTPRIVELLGLDAANELILEHGVSHINAQAESYITSFSQQGWFAGEESLVSQLAFLVLKDFAEHDQQTADSLNESAIKRLEELYYYTWGLKGKERELTFSTYKASSSYDEYYFSSLLRDVRMNTSFCTLLSEKISQL